MHIYGEWSKDYTKAFKNLIGTGSFGQVWLVKSNSTGKYFAMKEIDLKQSILKCSLINKAYALDEGLKLKYLNINHSNVVKYYESYILNNNETIYWIMEYCDGGTLRDKISIYCKNEIKIQENLIWYWSLQILSALKYLHSKSLIHRDLKPDNIYIENKTGSCKIGDFGLSKVLIDLKITDNTTIKFTRLEEENDNNNHNDSFNESESELNFCNSAGEEDESNRIKNNKNIILSVDEEEAAVVYKLINLSQVGTPAYMPPEMRKLIETHLNYCSIESVDNAHRICETHLYKGDIFSFGCILYEMTFLKAAFENKFSHSIEVFNKLNQKINNNLKNYSNDLKDLIKLTMKTNPEERLNINEIFKLDFIQDKLQTDYSSAYKQQVIPNLAINSNFARNNVLECVKVKLDNNYKPISMKSLKYNHNLIVIIASKHVNKIRNSSFRVITSTLNNLSPFSTANTTNLKDELIDETCVADSEDFVEESKIIIYDEFGQLYKEFNSFLISENNITNNNVDIVNNRELFNFKINDLCVDEENDHLYLSTKKYGILRFEIIKKNYYFEDLIFNGRLDLSELFSAENNINKFYPTCLNLIENESIFSDSMKTTNKRRLIFNDRLSKRIISIQIDLKTTNNPIKKETETLSFTERLLNNLIKCNINAGLTLDQRYVRQMVSTESELICLFDDLNLVNVYDLKTLLLKRTTNNNNNNNNNSSNTKLNNLSAKKNLFCLAVDSFNFLYSTDGECIFNLDTSELKPNKRIRPLIKKGENLSHIISWMTLLTNMKLILLSDAVQMENSLLFILNPVCKCITNTGNNRSNLNFEE